MTKVILESRDDGNLIIQLSWVDSDEYNIILTYSIVPKFGVNLCLILLFFCSFACITKFTEDIHPKILTIHTLKSKFFQLTF